MDEMHALKELIEAKFAAQNQRFDGQDRILVRIEEQTTKTNGRVNLLEKMMAAVLPRLDGHDREMREIKRPRLTSSSTVSTGENRGITQRDVLIVLGTVGALWAVIQAIGLLKAVTP